MIDKLDLSNLAQAEELLRLQKISYQVEAELIGFYEIPPLKDTLTSLQACDENFYGYFIEDKLAGAISYKRFGELLDIHRMLVSPDYFRRGIAFSLLKFVTELEQVGLTKIVVSTGARNEPAKNLYRRVGFQEVEEVEIVPGLFITRFAREI